MKDLVLRALLSVLLLLMVGCAGTRRTAFVDPQFDFTVIERVAVIPFENLSNDPGMGKYTTRVFMTELWAQQVFEIVEPGEVSAFMASQSVKEAAELSLEKLRALGKGLGVQGVFVGTVGESAPMRSGSLTSHVVSLDLRLVSVESGSTVWSATVTTGGPGFLAHLFGLGERSRGDAVRIAVRKAVRSLVR